MTPHLGRLQCQSRIHSTFFPHCLQLTRPVRATNSYTSSIPTLQKLFLLFTSHPISTSHLTMQGNNTAGENVELVPISFLYNETL